jgi:KDO2-lipid IV(A) lauroyltransferase
MWGEFRAARKRIKYKLLYYVVIGFIGIANLMPRKLWVSLCGSLGSLTGLLSRKLRMQIETHLSFAYDEMKPDEIRAMTRKVFVMLGKNAGLVLREFTNSTADYYAQSVSHGEQHAEKAFKTGRGVIFLTAHLGPYECLAHELSLKGYRPFIVGTPLKDPLLNSLLMQNRTRFGAVAIDRGKDMYRIMKNITSGGTMAILIDQDTSVKSVFVDFFGKPCSTPVGATVLALKTGAAVVPVFAHLNENGTMAINYYPEVEITKTGDEEKDIVTNTQKLTTIIENEIRKFPDQWVWMHRRWKTRSNLTV